MKYALVAFGAALLGALGGVYAGLRWFDYRGALEPDKAGIIRAQEIILADKQNHTLARLGSTDGDTTLEFFDPHDKNRPLIALTALSIGDTWLYLGNRDGGPDITLGANFGDADSPGPPESWGLEIQKGGGGGSIQAGIRRNGSSGMRIYQEKGKSWSAP